MPSSGRESIAAAEVSKTKAAAEAADKAAERRRIAGSRLPNWENSGNVALSLPPASAPFRAGDCSYISLVSGKTVAVGF
jgi:hypothetical protein